MAARVRTLPAAIAPVLVGTATAVYVAGELPRVGGFFAALLGSFIVSVTSWVASSYIGPTGRFEMLVVRRGL